MKNATLIQISDREREVLAELSEAIDDRTDLGDGIRKERRLWTHASNVVSRISARKTPAKLIPRIGWSVIELAEDEGPLGAAFFFAFDRALRYAMRMCLQNRDEEQPELAQDIERDLRERNHWTSGGYACSLLEAKVTA